MPMRRISLLFAAAILAVAVSACGGSSSAPKLGPNDVALVDGTLITKSQLDHRIVIETAAAKLQGHALPKVGTSAYTTEVIQGTVAQLVFEAEVKNVARKLGVTVTPADVQKQLASIIKTEFGGSQSKFDSYVKSVKLTTADVNDEVATNLYEHKIENKLTSQVKVSAAEVQAYYSRNLPSFTIAIDASSLHGTKPFSASLTPGMLETNFQKAVRTLTTGELSQPVAVSKAYMQSQLAGKCQPQCYFLIKPTGPATGKAGKQTRPVLYILLRDLATAQKARTELAGGKSWKLVAEEPSPLAQVSSEIRSTLLGQRRQRYFTSRWKALKKAEDKLVVYAPAYRPPSLAPTTSSSSTTASS